MKTKYFKLQEQMFRRFGAKPTEANILALIKSSTEAISLDEITKQTKYSLATVSNKVRKFETHGIIFRTKKPGSKKVFVEARKDYLNAMKEKLGMIHTNTALLIKGLPEIIKKSTNKKELNIKKEELRQAKISNKILSEALTKLEEY